MKVDVVIKNGRIITPAGVYDAGIAVDDGKIVSIAKSTHLPSADKIIDARSNIIMPGVIDAHVHFCDPGHEYREDWQTGTMAAACGGVTTVIEMPTTSPPTLTPENFTEKRKIAERKAFVDFALHAGVAPQTINNISDLLNAGAASFKMFLAEKVRETDRMDVGALYEALTRIGNLKALASFHAESELVSFLRKKLEDTGRKDLAAHIDSRPVMAEVEAIFRILLLAENTESRVHICHMTNGTGADLVREAKRRHIRVTLETCVHYLIFTLKDYLKLGPYLKVNPPIRMKEDKLALWNALRNGTIDIVASDHCPFPLSEKEIGWKNIWDAGTGIPGTETLLPLMVSEGVNRGQISIELLCRILAENPARVFGLYPQKGTLSVGADADIVIVDLKKKKKISVEQLHSKAEFTPYEGWEAKGFPTCTIVRGRIVSEHGEIVGKAGCGKFVSPALRRDLLPNVSTRHCS